MLGKTNATGGGSQKILLDGVEFKGTLKLTSGLGWAQQIDLPYNIYNGSAVVLNNEIHILGSSNNKTAHYKFNGSSWVEVSTLPYNFYYGSAIVLNNEIHILGANLNGYYTKHYKFNGSKWVEVSTLPCAVYNCPVLVLNGKINILHNEEHYKNIKVVSQIEVA